MAFSCDVLPTEGNPDWHIQDDVLNHLNDGWSMMIAFPPCTYLARSGLRWMIDNPQRRQMMINSAKFFNKLLSADIPHVCIENPIQHRFARQFIPPPTQMINPYWFGHTERKRTYLWLKGLPLLNPTVCLVNPARPLRIDKRGDPHYHTDNVPPGVERWKIRSRTFPGIAQAMAAQWG